jgi:hypothetical protein
MRCMWAQAMATRKIVSAPVVVAPEGHPPDEPLHDPSVPADILGVERLVQDGVACA